MGKIRKLKRNINNLVTPFGRGRLKTDTEDVIENYMKPIEAIREQLLSVHIEEKINGLQAFAVLAESIDSVTGLLDCDVVKIISPFMCDKDEALQNAATGALRNLSVVNSEICEFLINQDVVSPLLKMLCEIADNGNWTPTFDSTICNQIDLKSDTFLQGINLLWILSECDSAIVDLLSNSTLLRNVIKCLNYDIFGFEIAISVGQLLLIATEDNQKSWPTVKDNFLTLSNYLDLEGDSYRTYLRTLCAGIVANVHSVFDDNIERVILALIRTIEINNEEHLQEYHKQISQSLENVKFNMDDSMDTIEESEAEAAKRRRFEESPSSSEIALKKLEFTLEAQRLAVETITNMCYLDDQDSEDEHFESDCSESNFSVNGTDSMKIEIKQIFLNNLLIRKLWTLTNNTPENSFIKLSKEKELFLRKREQLRVETFVCLQNLCNIFDCEELGGAQFLYSVWVDLGQQIFQGSNDFCVVEPTTALMRSMLVHLKDRKDLFSEMTGSDLQLILDGVTSCPVSEIRANWLRMLGTLGVMVSNDLAELIIQVIIDVCHKEDDIWSMTEAIDSLMDIFSVDERNTLIFSLNLLERVKQIQAIYKKKVKQNKMTHRGGRKTAISTVCQNLSRFILYIEKEYINVFHTQ